ncbi:RNase P/RNase MRP complex subunit [Podila humilis]|nr:RNase P/RNase MRP complex subunit [Podila humilis]
MRGESVVPLTNIIPMDNSSGSNSNGNGLEKTSLNLYSQLPETIHKNAGIDLETISAISTDPQTFIPDFVGNAVVEGYEGDKVYSEKVKHKIFQLDNPAKDRTAAVKEQSKRRKRANKSKVLTAKEKRELHVYDIPLEARKYELFLPLNALWKGYMQEIFGSCSPTAFTQKLLKADFHGAIITVTRSKCPTYIGATGIVAQETENVFKIITLNNSLRVIPKVNNVFSIAIKNSVFTLHGNQFRYRSSQRSTKKFKSKPTIDL